MLWLRVGGSRVDWVERELGLNDFLEILEILEIFLTKIS